ncbi:DNA polymerase III subunit epsilon [Xanthobacter dioxanivorans]|uniref:DNA-directed DNA polymerase n=1 Tax=Xanthobacter dioxanivorans TaxID=2528964 RepID=A0A974SKP8_9HYPH|nr:exonuclease domain-containing protein [Xanthobacter dioxanivorans]QRG07748.1 DNA polymerase III subunit epsilon [Xanthobacter dioxanivorans]
MSPGRRLVLAVLTPGAILGLWFVLGAGLLYAALGEDERASVVAALAPLVDSHGMLVVLWWFLAAAGLGLLARRLHAAYVEAPARLADATRVLAGDAAGPDVTPQGSPGTRVLAEAVNALAGQRRALEQDMARLVADASRDVAVQRDQLAALMAELAQSVVVLNLEGRILLYNARARGLFRRLSPAPGGAGGAELIGLGRSIHAVIDRALIDHAREGIEARIARGDARASARFVTTTPLGHLIQVSLAPVRAGADQTAAINGFVLLLDDITEEYEAQSRQDRRWLDLSEASRASFASMQAALDMLDYPDLDPADRERFQAVVRDEVGAMSARLTALAATASQDMKTRWPLQDMLGADLVAAAAQRIAAETGRRVATDAVDGDIWLSVDSFALIKALAFLAARLVEAVGEPDLALRLAPAGGRAHLDLAWSGTGAPGRRLTGWQTSPMQAGDAPSPLSVRDVVERHGGELWLEHARDGAGACFRFLLPVAAGVAPEVPAPGESRPAYYDFDLFAASAQSRESDDQPLGEIAYTVFDTETTGLDPAGGDEILQIGATRIVNGRLLASECFDQLVDPERSIPEAGIAVHGIRPEMVRGKPRLAAVLPAFHAFAAETVLVGHNVAFDLRFLTLKADATGVRFDQPVLDTLLLGGVVHPGEDNHSLEAMAARLGVAVAGRHTALGDALATAEIFLKLLPLLRQRGILTLGQARAAAQTSYYARLRY